MRPAKAGSSGAGSGEDDRPDAELWRALRGGPDGEAALAAIYDRYAGLVYGLALRILANPEEAEDLSQEVFVALYERSAYDPSRGSLGTYLAVYTRSRAIDHLRRSARQRRLGDELGIAAALRPHPDSPLERTSTMESARQVAEALAKLPERQRQALELAYYRGLTQTEIAAELGAPLGTVKSTVRAALQSLRTALGHLLG